MSRKGLLIIIIAIILVLGLLGGFYYYLKLKSETPGSGNGLSLKDFFPFGKSPSPTGAGSTDNTSTQTNQTNEVSNTNPPVLRHIADFPIAGASIFDRTIISTSTVTSTSTKGKVTTKVVVLKNITNAIRYMERSTGNIFETATTTITSMRVSNTTFPKVYEALFDATGENLIARTLAEDTDTISTYFGHLTKDTPTSTTESLSTSLISQNVDVAVLSPSKTRLFSLGNDDGEKGVVSTIDGSKKSVVWTSFLKEWLPTWVNEDNIILSTKPSATVNSIGYILNIPTKSFKKIGNALPGLTLSMSPDQSYIIYASSDVRNQSLQFGLLDKNGKAPTPLFVKTLPEKCVWSQKEKAVVYCAVPDFLQSATYPDDWYKGIISFSDSIWKINVSTGESKDIAPIQEMVHQGIDGIDLSLDSKEDYLLFTNKKDLSLWGLMLAPASASTSTPAN